MLLKEIAHSRTGDKGNISVISVIAYKDEDYKIIREKVTEEKLKEYFISFMVKLQDMKFLQSVL